MEAERNLHPWRGVTLDEALTELLAALEQRIRDDGPLPCAPPGRSREEIRAREAELGREIPADVMQLYETVDGFRVTDADFWIWPLERIHWLDYEGTDCNDSILKFLHKSNSGWKDAEYFAFGQGIFGDQLTFCVNPPRSDDSLVAVLDYEEQGPDDNPEQPGVIVVLADTLAEWIARFVVFDLVEYGYHTGGVDELQPDKRLAFISDHLRLNPGARWLEERLAALDSEMDSH